jgi:3-oxoacyl-[acyl-carrier protein] reductase
MADQQQHDGRVAIVTGGSRGIGRQCAERLAADGIAVVISYAASHKEADATVDSVTDGGGRAIAVAGDVADEDAMAALFDQAEQAFGGVDIVVHAAGKIAVASLAELDLKVFDDLNRTNVRGTFVVNQQAARRLRPGGSILNFSTSVVGTSLPNYSAYVASKGAVEAITMILARELRGRDVTVNTIAPGPTAGDFLSSVNDEESLSRLAHAVPLDRLGTPADIAEVVAFLTSPAGHWVNGQRVRANGGLV